MVEGILSVLRMWPIIAACSIVYWFHAYSEFKSNELEPRLAEIEGNRTQIRKLDVELSTLQDKIQRIPELKKTVAELTSQLDVRLSQLPRDFNVATILRQMNDLGKRSSLDFAEFKISPEIITDFYAKLNIQMVLKGSYPQILLFFDRLAKINRIFNINNIEFQTAKDKATTGLSSVKAVATTFRFVEESGFGGARGGP